MSLCFSCARGLCDECTDYTLPEGQCCHDRQGETSALSPESPSVGRPRKDDDEISTSAGRKRAAVEYEINSQAACEWSGKSNCGGGVHPIVGCVGNSQAHRHHGPIKHTAHNERGNVHRICARCHNTWHAKNDPIYDEARYATLPHNPRQMTRLEAIQQAAATIKE
jgi:hypothetical protein